MFQHQHPTRRVDEPLLEDEVLVSVATQGLEFFEDSVNVLVTTELG